MNPVNPLNPRRPEPRVRLTPSFVGRTMNAAAPAPYVPAPRPGESEAIMPSAAFTRLPLLVVIALLIPGCTKPLDTLGPTPAGEGATIYIHAGFAGSSQALNQDVGDLEKVEGPCTHGEEGEKPTWSDCMSSVRVESGWRVTLYRDRDFKGNSVSLTTDTPNLGALPGPCDGSFNDCVSSIKVSRQ